MSLLTWLAVQRLSDWVQGLGSLSAAGAAVGIRAPGTPRPPPRQWDAGLCSKLDAIGTAVGFLESRLDHHIDALKASRPPAANPTASQKSMIAP